MKPVRLLLSLAATRGWKISKYDGLVQPDAPIDELLMVLPPHGMLPEGSAFIARKALYGTSRASSIWRKQYARLVEDAGWTPSVIFPDCYHRQDGGFLVCRGGDVIAAASEDELNELDRIHDPSRSFLAYRLDIKRRARIGPGAPGWTDFLKHGLCWNEQREVFTWAGKAKYVHDAEETLRRLGEFHDTQEVLPSGATVDTELPLRAVEQEQYESAAGALVRTALERPDIERSVKSA